MQRETDLTDAAWVGKQFIHLQIGTWEPGDGEQRVMERICV